MPRGKTARVDTLRLKKLIEATNNTPKEIAEELGVAPDTVRTALRNNEMSKLMDVAVEGLLRRVGGGEADKLVLVRGAPASIEILSNVAEGLGCRVVDLEF